MRNFVEAVRGTAQEDLIKDGWTRFNALMKKHAKPGMTAADFEALAQMVNYELMEDVRARVDTVVKDPETAESLKPWYDWLCKRPCYHDEYLDVFNQPNVTLVDTHGKGIERITEDSVFANGQEFKLDCLIFATGFELSPFEQGTPIPVIGRGGQTLAEKWADGATTLHGMHVHGFPNFMLSGTRQASWDNNFPFSQEIVASHLARLIRDTMDRGVDTIEVTEEAEADWVRFHESRATRLLTAWRDCTPSYFNNEGKPQKGLARNGMFGGSPLEFIEILEKWNASGDMPGLKLDRAG
jgi:cyclohexanone monooxygenase